MNDPLLDSLRALPTVDFPGSTTRLPALARASWRTPQPTPTPPARWELAAVAVVSVLYLGWAVQATVAVMIL